MNNKIIITGRKNEEREERAGLYGIDRRRAVAAGTGPDTDSINPADQDMERPEQDTVHTERPPLDENVWGNDHTLLNKLSEKQLADRRLFVRIRHMQRIECDIVFDSINSEPALLEKPLVFIVNELSMAGIGIICDHAIDIGKILAFRFSIDNIPYDIKSEVIYCIPNDDKFRACLKVVQRDKRFIRHLKIFIARTSLNITYGKHESADISNHYIPRQLMA